MWDLGRDKPRTRNVADEELEREATLKRSRRDSEKLGQAESVRGLEVPKKKKIYFGATYFRNGSFMF